MKYKLNSFALIFTATSIGLHAPTMSNEELRSCNEVEDALEADVGGHIEVENALEADFPGPLMV